MENEKNTIKVLLADDHQSMIDGLRSVLVQEKDIEIVAEANNGIEVLNRLEKIEVNVVVLDIGMPEMNGHHTLVKIREKFDETKVLILSLHKDEKNIRKVLNEGISGYVIKDRGTNEIILAIKEIASGGTYFDKEVTKIMTNLFKNDKRKSAQKKIKFSDSEEKVLKLLALNMSSKEIGKKLNISHNTVETHKKHAASKLGIKIAELKAYAIKLKYEGDEIDN